MQANVQAKWSRKKNVVQGWILTQIPTDLSIFLKKKKLFIWLPQLDELNGRTGRTFFTFNFVLRPLHWPRQQISADLRFDECEFYTSVCRSFYICRKIKMPRIDLNGEQKFNGKFAKSNFSRGID